MDITRIEKLVDMMRAKGVLHLKTDGIELMLGAEPAPPFPEQSEPEVDETGLSAKYLAIPGLTDGI